MLLFGNLVSFVLLQLLLLSIIVFVSCKISPYITSKSCAYKQGVFGDLPQIKMHGSCENYISSAAKCREEIERLELRFVNKNDFQDANMEALGVVSPSSDRPPGCYGYNANFFFNTDRQSPQSCGYHGRMCVCQEPACQPCPKESYSYGGLNVRCTPCPRETNFPDEVRKHSKIVEQCEDFWRERNTYIGL